MKYNRFIIVGALILTVLACEDSAQLKRPAFAELPTFADYTNVEQKKQAFSDYLQPIIHAANQQLLAYRSELINLQPYIKQLNHQQQQRLLHLSELFRVSTDLTLSQQLRSLLQKVDAVPPALVMVQAANESAWGTSRFAVQGNNLFGQWCFSQGCGLVPLHRSAGDNHEVMAFDSVYDSVYAYMLNLNRHPAYAELREQRALQRQSGQLDAQGLVPYLSSYSERGQAYTDELSAMLRVNRRIWPNDYAVN